MLTLFFFGRFSSTSQAGLKKHTKKLGSLFHTPYLFLFNWGVSLTHPVLVSFLSGVFLLHIPCWLFFFFLFFFFWEFLKKLLLFFHLMNFSYTSRAGFIFIWGVSLNTSHACLIFLWGVSLTHPFFLLYFFSSTSHTCFFLSGEFLLHISCWLHFNRGSFSYTSRAGFVFIFYF